MYHIINKINIDIKTFSHEVHNSHYTKLHVISGYNCIMIQAGQGYLFHGRESSLQLKKKQ